MSRKFQFTPLREGRQSLPHHVGLAGHISIHAPPRGATVMSPFGGSSGQHFNSRPSARGDRNGATGLVHLGLFQFTPLREGRQYERHKERGHVHISIHAPPRGATTQVISPMVTSLHFNSRPSARGDSRVMFRCAICAISIHAPPRGAT